MNIINSILHRKESFIIRAVEIIDDIGIQGLSTREIARREGVSEATLFRHFKNKNSLLAAVLDYFSKFDEDIFQSINLKGLRPKEAILFFINSYMEYYENYPEITSIIGILDVLIHEPGLDVKIKAIVNNRVNYIKQIIEEGQKLGDIRPDIDSEGVSHMLLGYCKEICFRWRLNGKNFSLRNKVYSSLEVVLELISNG